jgi:biotin carboxyl carrier protein
VEKYTYKIDNVTYEVNVKEVTDSGAEVEVNGVPYHVDIPMAGTASKPVVPRPAPKAETPNATPVAKRAGAGAVGAGAIVSPLPGVILTVKCKEGDGVKQGDVLLVLEAMKMENSIEADRDGHVVKLHVAVNDQVMEGDPLVTLGE